MSYRIKHASEAKEAVSTLVRLIGILLKRWTTVDLTEIEAAETAIHNWIDEISDRAEEHSRKIDGDDYDY